ncbi:hypothetical protein C4D60_Mb11t13010 [Musa balbisiana]|uniref:Uncharacterized protein n=1 Tax=Musa balbisiana TaxID=52838 RepID=A0A4S8J3Q4_MUSBA|nr:hypothetical protein C4D60_Mb11t13010 [Musa balbisiana]
MRLECRLEMTYYYMRMTSLKRRTVAARRRHRDRAGAKIRKTAEKLLLNHLKAKRLEELAAEIKKQKEGSKEKEKERKLWTCRCSQLI